MPNIKRGERLVRKWAGPMGFGSYNIEVSPLPDDQKGKVWGRSYWNAEEEWAHIELLPDSVLPPAQLEALVIHELAHGLVHVASKSDVGVEMVCNRIARLVCPEVELCNEWYGKSGDQCEWEEDPMNTAWMRLLVDALPEEEKLVINSLYYERRTLNAVAAELGVSSRTIGRIKRRALAKLNEAAAQLEERSE